MWLQNQEILVTEGRASTYTNQIRAAELTSPKAESLCRCSLTKQIPDQFTEYKGPFYLWKLNLGDSAMAVIEIHVWFAMWGCMLPDTER